MKDFNYYFLLALEEQGKPVMSNVRDGKPLVHLTSGDNRVLNRICNDELGRELPSCYGCLKTRETLMKLLYEKFAEHQEGLKKMDELTEEEKIKFIESQEDDENEIIKPVKRGRKPKGK